MANFDIAYKPMEANEGGFADVPGDNGGMTYCGIAINSFPNWTGWATVKKRLPLKHGQILPELNQAVKEFYRVNFWNKVKGDMIVNQKSATDIFDMAVNAGVKKSIILAQKALGITESGVMDTFTLDKLNNKK